MIQLSDEQVSQLKKMHASGTSIPALAREFGVSTGTIHNWKKKYGLPDRQTAAFPVDREAEFAADYEAGVPVAELREKYGIETRTVRYAARRLGLQLRPRGFDKVGKPMPAEQRRRLSEAKRALFGREEELRTLADGTRSCAEIAVEMHVSEEVVREEMARLGISRLPSKARPTKNAFWRGGVSVDKHGYVQVLRRDDPEANATGYVRVHRIVMREVLGRDLLPGEVVDHKNGDKSDNRPENLQLYRSNADHLRATLPYVTQLTPEEREETRQQDVQRARSRVAASLAGTETCALPSPSLLPHR